MRRERMDRLETEIKNLTKLADNLDRRMEDARSEKYLKQKSLEKKNLALEEVREFRKKLNEKEKEISVAIEKLENEKMEIIFAQVKRGIKNEKLDVTSKSVQKMLGVLRENQVTETE